MFFVWWVLQSGFERDIISLKREKVMGKRFKEIRVFCGNEYVGHHFYHIEFVIDNKNSFQEIITRLSAGSRIHLSRSKTGEYVFDPYQESKYFIKALKNTDLSQNLGATRYDEACLLAQDYTNRRSGINYYKDDDNLMTIDELLNIASEVCFGEDKDGIAKFKQECLEVLHKQEIIQESEEKEQ